MTVSSALHILTHIIALMGFLSLLVTGEVGIGTTTIFLIALVNSFVKGKYNRGLSLNHAQTVITGLLLIVYVLLSVFFLGRGLFDAIMALLVYLQVIKLLGEKSMRDTFQIYLMSFFQFLAGTILTVDINYGIAFIAYLFVAIVAVMVLNMKKEADRANIDPRLHPKGFLMLGMLIGMGILLTTAFLFFSVPRLGFGFAGTPFLSPKELRTGFSDEVELGMVGEIKRDDSPVMMVRFRNARREDLPHAIYWRGIALDEFDGVRWRASHSHRDSLTADRDGIIWLDRRRGAVLEQEIVTEPIDSNVLFAADMPVAFKDLSVRRVERVNDSYRLPYKFGYRHKYAAYSVIETPDRGGLRQAVGAYPDGIEHYLMLPPVSERLVGLAKDITSGLVSPYDKAVAIAKYLRSNLSYTLTLKKGEEAFPLDDFLFSRRAGHCEYFATAMAVLLRLSGVPSRIVNGFYGGEWNEFGGFFLVRESDAHSWVEAYIPGSGWVRFDPSPATFAGSTGWAVLSYISSYYDYLRYRWSRYVIDYSRRDQIRVISRIGSGWEKVGIGVKPLGQVEAPKKLIIAVAVIAAVLWVIAVRRSPFNHHSLKGRAKKHKASAMYEKSLKILASKGYEKTKFQTQREFASEVLRKGGVGYELFSGLTDKYLSLRFGRDASEMGYHELGQLVEELKKLCKKDPL